MKILIAPNSMKGSLNAFDFADIIEKALLSSSLNCTIRKIPVADGGDFTGEILSRVVNGNSMKLTVTGPLGDLTDATYWISDKIAIIEMAEASGMKKVNPEKLNPLKASSFGTGELIMHAMKRDCSEIWLTIGGSATVDGGMGMLEALGFRFFDSNGNKLQGNGGNLDKIAGFQKPDFSEKVKYKIICDVSNPLLGENGAAKIFGPQKGATHEMVVQLENGLKNWNDIICKETGQSFSEVKGSGAAGGISLGLMAFYNTTMEPGAKFILNQLNFEDHVKWADIVITGEGKIDSQTNNLKAPFVVAQTAREFNKPVYAFAGISENPSGDIYQEIHTLKTENISPKEAMENTC